MAEAEEEEAEEEAEAAAAGQRPLEALEMGDGGEMGEELDQSVQGWTKEWALGCVNPASWLPPAA